MEQCGFEDIRADVKLPRLGIDVSFIARDGDGEEWAFELAGTFTSSGAGLRRADALWRAVGKASIWHQARGAGAFVVLTTDAPAPRTASRVALDLVTGPDKPITDVIELLDTAAHERLRSYAGTVARHDPIDRAPTDLTGRFTHTRCQPSERGQILVRWRRWDSNPRPPACKAGALAS